MPNKRIIAGSIDQDGYIIWGTGDFESRRVQNNLYWIMPEHFDSECSSVTCSLNNEFFGPNTDNLITFNKQGHLIEFRIRSLEDDQPNVPGSFDFIIVSDY